MYGCSSLWNIVSVCYGTDNIFHCLLSIFSYFCFMKVPKRRNKSFLQHLYFCKNTNSISLSLYIPYFFFWVGAVEEEGEMTWTFPAGRRKQQTKTSEFLRKGGRALRWNTGSFHRPETFTGFRWDAVPSLHSSSCSYNELVSVFVRLVTKAEALHFRAGLTCNPPSAAHLFMNTSAIRSWP